MKFNKDTQHADTVPKDICPLIFYFSSDIPFQTFEKISKEQFPELQQS